MSPYVQWQDRFGFDIDLAKQWHRQGKADSMWYAFAAKWADHLDSKGYPECRRRAMALRAMLI